jgi:O-antigen/teichoic acid export membrane protein
MGIGGGLRRLAPHQGLLRSSALLFVGDAAARFLGLLFSVTAARVLLPATYGLFAYGLAVSSIAATLLTNAPNGLARFLAVHQNDRQWQRIYLTNWLVVVALTLALSLVALVPIGLFLKLSGWIFIGAVANLVGVAVFTTYREAQRGLGRFSRMVVYYLLSNLLQLVAVIAAAALGWRSPALFLTIYGLSSVVALILIERTAPIALHAVRATVSRNRLLAVFRFIRPLLVQTVFYAVWSGIDLVLVARLLNTSAAGNYAVAKTLAGLVVMAPWAIGVVVGPRVALLDETIVPGYVARVLALTAAVTAPVAVALLLFRGPIIALVFGSGYSQAASPLSLLVIGVALYALFYMFGNVWTGLGYPQIEAVGSGVGMITTVSGALVLLPRAGIVGASAAYAAGSAAQLMVIGGFTLWALRKSKSVHIRRFVDRPLLESLQGPE